MSNIWMLLDLVSATMADLDLLTQMNIQLRKDEQIDNSMSESDINQRMTGFLNDTDYKVLLLKNGLATIGYSLVQIKSSPLYLRQLFITESERNKGFGSQAIQKLCEYFQVQDLDIEVMTWNTSAYNFYKRNGFVDRYIGMRKR
jgi:RimJ/RimL family protein N-acetyltransferase